MAKKQKNEKDLADVDVDKVSSVMAESISDIQALYKGSEAIKIDTLENMYADIMPKGYISTGDYGLDLIISNMYDGGLPLGKFIDISGDSSVGKSLIAGCFASEFQRRGGFVLWFDTEKASFPPFMEVLGVQPNKTIFVPQTRQLERIFEIIIKVVINNKKRDLTAPLLIIVDSMTATNLAEVINDIETFKSVGYQSGALKQKVMGEAFQKILDYIKDEYVCFLSVNQVRDNLERANKYSDKTRSTSGNAQRFYSDIRLDLKLKEQIKNKEGEIIGKVVKVKTIKNRIAPSPRETTLYVYGMRGLDKYKSFIEKLKEYEIVKSTSHGIKYTKVNGEELRNEDGKMYDESKFKVLIRKDVELFSELYKLLAEQIIKPYERKGEEYFDDVEEDVIFETADTEGEVEE